MGQVLEQSVATDRCYRCDYDLRGIADDQACPECGLLALRSRQPTDEIRFTHPKWLRAVSLGVKLILLSILLLIVWPAIMAFTNTATQNQFRRNAFVFSPTLVAQAPLLGAYLALFLFIIGVLLLTRKQEEANGVIDGAERRHQIMLRCSMLLAVALMGLSSLLLQHGVNKGFYYSSTLHAFWMSREIEILYELLAVGILTSVVPMLLFLWLRRIAKRARSAHLAEHCAIVGVGMSVTILFIAFFLWAANDPAQFGLADDWLSRGTLSLYLGMFSIMWPLLFSIWSVYLLSRFAFRFHRVAREQSRAWRSDDAKRIVVN